MRTVIFDERECDLDQLSDKAIAAKAEFGMLQFVDAELQYLAVLTAILETA